MAGKTNTMASHRMIPLSEKAGSRGASIRTFPEMLPTIMPGGRASRMEISPGTGNSPNQHPPFPKK